MDLVYLLSAKELYDQALIFKQNQDYDNYIIYITMAANHGYPDAIDNIYKCDTYLKQNYAKTINFYKETAYNNEMPNSYSLHFLAYMYVNGLGMKRDMYDRGLGCKIDYNKAIELYKTAIKKGNIAALNNLAYLYGQGLGVKQNYVYASELLEKAIEVGNVMALNNLAYLYEYGLGVKQNYLYASQLFEKAIELGDITKLHKLELIYRKHLPLNYNKILKIYKIGITRGDIQSISEMTNLMKFNPLETEKSMT